MLSFYTNDIEEKFDFPKSPILKRFTTSLPEDAQTEGLTRIDHDTCLGGIVEINVPKRKKLNKLALKGKRFNYLHTFVTKQTKLINRDQGSEETNDN